MSITFSRIYVAKKCRRHGKLTSLFTPAFSHAIKDNSKIIKNKQALVIYKREMYKTGYTCPYIACSSKPLNMKYIFVLGLVLSVMACNRSNHRLIEKPKEQNATLIAFYATYGLEPALPDVTALKNALSGNIYAQIKEDLDFEKVQLLSSTETNELIYIVALKQKHQFYAVRARKGETLVVQDELLFSGKMEDDKNGTIGILKNGQAITIEFKNAQKIIKAMTEREFKATFAEIDSAPRFCQRQPGQSYGDCFRQESEEFCDSFVSCVALATQPQVSMVIALACSCNA